MKFLFIANNDTDGVGQVATNLAKANTDKTQSFSFQIGTTF